MILTGAPATARGSSSCAWGGLVCRQPTATDRDTDYARASYAAILSSTGQPARLVNDEEDSGQRRAGAGRHGRHPQQSVRLTRSKFLSSSRQEADPGNLQGQMPSSVFTAALRNSTSSPFTWICTILRVGACGTYMTPTLDQRCAENQAVLPPQQTHLIVILLPKWTVLTA